MSAIHEHVLQNGMTLLCWPQRHLHGLEFGLYLKGGPLYETEETQGISNLLEHLLLHVKIAEEPRNPDANENELPGIGGLNREGLLRELNRFGTNLDAATYAEGLVFRLKCLPRFFDAALEYFLRFFANVPWTPEQIAAEKQVVLRQLEADGEGDLFDRAACDFRKTENGAFPPLGTPESLMALTEADIQLWQEMIFQPQNACLVMTGNFSDGMELAAIEALSELRNTTAQPPFTQSLPIGFCMRDEQSDLLEEVESDFASVQLAFDVDSEQVYPVAAEVLSTITAGNDDSMLFQALREEQALVAEIESQISRVGQFSRLVIRYDVRSEWLKDTLTKVFAYLHRLTMYVRPARLNQLRTQFTTNNAMLTDDTAALNDRGDTARADLDAAAAQYNELTAEELLDAAQTVFRPENLTIAVQYDPEAVGDLRPLLQKLRETL
mgnify:CR=1 FL=1